MSGFRKAVIGVAAVAAALGCAPGEKFDRYVLAVCEPDEVRECECEKGGKGEQTCDESQTGWLDCACSQDTAGQGGGTDSDAATDSSGTGTGTGMDTDTDTNIIVPIEMDCSKSDGVGGDLDHLFAAFDICDKSIVIDQGYRSLTPLNPPHRLDMTYEAIERFGDEANDLKPLLNGSYVLLSTGYAEFDRQHSVDLDATGEDWTDSPSTDDYYDTDDYYGTDDWWDDYDWKLPPPGPDVDTEIVPAHGVKDPYNSAEKSLIFDAVEWRMVLKAPEEAKAFRFRYVFFSAEYDEFISSEYNDKFYVLLRASSTANVERKVINFTTCREPMVYSDFICQKDEPGCTPGERYCYIAINSAYSDCCWYNGCGGYDTGANQQGVTDISGTGFECATEIYADGTKHGSSTGWLQTTWPVKGGEEIELTFHIHDTQDGIYDSAVILDGFEFLKTKSQGTTVTI